MPTLEDLRKQRQQRARQIPTPAPVSEEEEDNTPDFFKVPTKTAPKPAAMPDAQPSAELNWQAPERKLDAPEWEAARKNPALLGAIKRYAKNVEDADFSSDDQAFDWFVGDRRWKDSNTISTLKELNFVKGTFGAKWASEEDLKDLSVIRDEWDKLPGGFTRIGRGIKDLNASEVVGGAGAILENVAKGTVDPSILIGGLFGKGAGALVTRGGSAATKAGVKRALQTGTAISADAGIAAGANAAYQEVNVEAGLQDEISGWEMIVSGGLGGALSAPGAISTFKPKGLEKVDPLKAVEQSLRKDAELRAQGITDYFGSKGSGQTPDGRKLTLDDVGLMKDSTLSFENFSKEFSKATGVSRKGTGLMGSKVVEADETFYDPLLDTMHVKAGSKLSKEDITTLEPLAAPIVDAKWKKEKLSVTIEDGSKVEVEAGTVAKSLTARLKQADDLMMCLTK